MGNKEIVGVHHVTAIASDPQQNINFYSGVLGLRLVKLTVNYDDPGTYHLYYGDGIGNPGSIITFFPWPSGEKGRHGNGQLTTTSFSVPEDSLDYWMLRFKDHRIFFDGPTLRFNHSVVSFVDPDGLKLELVANGNDNRKPWEYGPVPPEKAIRGFHGVTLSEEGYERTAMLLKDTLGFKPTISEKNRFRYVARDSEAGGIVDIICTPAAHQGHVNVGTVHHVAWRTHDDEEQKEWRREIVNAGLNVTPIIDRKYFHSIYFREPGGVLFEIATDPPGFTIDETPVKLGTRLVLPDWLEPLRKNLKHVLPPIKLPDNDQSSK